MQNVFVTTRTFMAGIILSALLMTTQVFAQPSLTLEREFGSNEVCEGTTYNYVEYANSLATTSDAGAVMFGPMYQSCGLYNSSPTAVKVNRFGNMQWNRTYLIESPGLGFEIVDCANGELAFTCTGVDGVSGIQGALVVRTTAGGGPVWSTIVYCDIEMVHQYHPESIIEAANGDIVICGSVEHMDSQTDRRDVFMARLDAGGVLLWSHYYTWAPGIEEVARFLREDSAGDLIVAGHAIDRNTIDTDGLIMKTNANGIVVWAHHYGSANISQEFESLVIDFQDNIYAVGFWDRGNAGADAYVVKAAGLNGNLIGAAHMYDVAPNSLDGAYSINPALNGTSFVVAGEAVIAPGALNQYGSFAMEIPPALGAPTWIHRYGFTNTRDQFRSVESTPGLGVNPAPGYWMAGGKDPSGVGGTDLEFYLVRTNQIGEDLCTSNTLPVFSLNYDDEEVKYQHVTCATSTSITLSYKSIMVQNNICIDIIMKGSTQNDNAPINGQMPLLSPNPVVAGESIALEPGVEAISRVEVRDILGREVFRHELANPGETVQVETVGWSAGTYVVTFVQPDGKTVSASLQVIK